MSKPKKPAHIKRNRLEEAERSIRELEDENARLRPKWPPYDIKEVSPFTLPETTDRQKIPLVWFEPTDPNGCLWPCQTEYTIRLSGNAGNQYPNTRNNR